MKNQPIPRSELKPMCFALAEEIRAPRPHGGMEERDVANAQSSRSRLR